MGLLTSMMSFDVAAVVILGAVSRVLKVAARGPAPFRRRLEALDRALGERRFRYMYRSFSHFAQENGPVFMNYGIKVPVAEAPMLEAADEPNWLFIQMYHRAIAGIDLTRRDVLEVSCGHGGGSRYVAHYIHPRRMLGVDINDKAVEMCRARHNEPGLEFAVGNAVDLPLADSSFDAVISIEASHRYPSFETFLREVYRLLRPGGHLMFADLRWEEGGQRAMLSALKQSGMSVISMEDLTPMVVELLNEFASQRRASMTAIIPGPLLVEALDNSAVPGSPLYQAFTNKWAIYQRALLRKPMA